MLIYGLSTWLPGVMTEAGYSVDSALSFLLLFQGGRGDQQPGCGWARGQARHEASLRSVLRHRRDRHSPVERQDAIGSDLLVRWCGRGRSLRRDCPRVRLLRPVLSREQPRDGAWLGGG